MLSRPDAGWTAFLGEYYLSYITDIPAEWLRAAIFGLENRQPFCVRGEMEPGTMFCMVDNEQCYISTCDDGQILKVGEIPMTMNEFCEKLYIDLLKNKQEWIGFGAFPADNEWLSNFNDGLEKLGKLLKS